MCKNPREGAIAAVEVRGKPREGEGAATEVRKKALESGGKPGKGAGTREGKTGKAYIMQAEFSLPRLLFAYYVMINVTAYIVYFADKYKAQRRMWRVSENALLGLAIAGGAFGGYAAMRIYHHKTRHKKFTVTVPLFFFFFLCIMIFLMGRFSGTW